MKKSVHVLIGVFAIALLLGGSASADDVYMVTYYSNANTTNAPDGTLRFRRSGATVANGVSQPLNANIYVFDDTEEIPGMLRLPGIAGWFTLGIGKPATHGQQSPAHQANGWRHQGRCEYWSSGPHQRNRPGPWDGRMDDSDTGLFSHPEKWEVGRAVYYHPIPVMGVGSQRG